MTWELKMQKFHLDTEAWGISQLTVSYKDGTLKLQMIFRKKADGKTQRYREGKG